MDKAFATAAALLTATFFLAVTATGGEPQEIVEEIGEEVAETDIVGAD